MEYELITGETFPEVWEKALKICWERGVEVRTDYEKKTDPPSKDLTTMLVVKKPEKEPRYHRAAFPMGVADLLDYVNGIKEGIINSGEIQTVEDSYPNRLVNYHDNYGDKSGNTGNSASPEQGINQIEYVIKELNRAGYSKKAQAILWNPKIDLGRNKESPDLIRLWFRIVEGRLNMNAYMCSNDLFKANFANMMGFFAIQKHVARELAVPIGSYCHVVDSLHINGAYYEEVRSTLEQLSERDWQEKTWTSEDISSFG